MSSDAETVVERFVVERNYHGWRLDRYLTEKLKRATRSLVTRLVRSSVTLSDGRRVKAGTRLRAGEVVLIERHEHADPETPSLDRVRVLEEAGDYVVVDKPAGLLVHRSARESVRTVEAFLAEHFADERVEPVHRLDRDSSGCLVCGRGLDAIRRLRGAFAQGTVRKRYVALVVDEEGRWEPGVSARIEIPLGFAADASVALRVGRGEWPCATTVTGLERRDERVALVAAEIEGGRQHQIRAHLALEGTPVLGDKLYGMGDAFFLAWCDDPGAPELVAQLAVRWHALHAVEVVIEAEGLRVRSELPQRFGSGM